jgi:uncharacterized protein (DUF2147 family)
MYRFSLLLCFFFFQSFLYAQSITGKWKTFDDKTGQEESIVKIYREDGKYHGKIIEVLREDEEQKDICTKCEGELKNQPIIGLRFLRGFEKEGDEYVGGLITDPKNGNTYKSKMWLDEENPDLLHVRGYVLFFHRTQTWKRVE